MSSRLGERGDIIRTLQRAMSGRGQARALTDYTIFESDRSSPLTGRLVERGLSDELNDRHYLIIDGTDGRSHYVEIGRGEATDFIPAGAVVRIAPKPTDARAVDRTVADVAAAHDGRYSIDIHLRHDPHVTEAFAERRATLCRSAGSG